MTWIDTELLHRGAEGQLRIGDTTIDGPALRAAVLERQRAFGELGIDENSSVMLRAAPGPAAIVDLLALLRSESQVLLLDHRLTDDIAAAAHEQVGATHEIVSTAQLPPMKGFVLADTEVRPLSCASARSDDAILQVSSGTTDTPKIIRRSIAELSAETERYRSFPGVVRPGEAIVVASSIVHTWGLFGGILLGLAQQCEVVLPERQTAAGIVQAVTAGNRTTTVLGVPLHVAMLRGGAAPRQLRSVLSAGAPLDAASRAPWDHVRVGQTYGMTEVGVIAADLLGEFDGRMRLASDLRASVAESGELMLALERSPYTHEHLDRWTSGWFATRDAVELDERGVMLLLGRLDGLVSLGGRKVHAVEIEAHLTRSSAVNEAVVFITDGTVEAFVTLETPNLDVDAITGMLPEYMRPHRVTVLSELPKTVTGKTLRRRDAYGGTYA